MIALFEKEVAFEREKLDLPTAQHKSPEFKKLQPFGVVPAIDDDGYLLYGTALDIFKDSPQNLAQSFGISKPSKGGLERSLFPPS